MKTLCFTTTNRKYEGLENQDQFRFNTDNFNNELIMNDEVKQQYKTCYIHNEAEDIAGFDIPAFFNGDMGQLLLPIEEQKINMYIDNKIYSIKALPVTNSIGEPALHLVLTSSIKGDS